MREILFRGRIKNTKEWVYWDVFGRLCSKDNMEVIQFRVVTATTDDYISYNASYYDYVYQIYDLLDKETVGQCVELPDKNGNKIFEGDILYDHCEFLSEERYRYFIPQGKLWESGNNFYNKYELKNFRIYLEIIGNIHDNPELWEDK